MEENKENIETAENTTQQNQETETVEEQKNESVSEDKQEENSVETKEEDTQVQVEIESNSVEKLEKELTESKDKYLRLYADFENLRKRSIKEKAELIQNANANLLKDLLSVLDDFERAQKSMEESEDIKALKEGIDLIHNKFFKILQNKGVKLMENQIEQPFDLETQESITQIPVPTEEMKGKVVDVIEKGYFLNDKVLRFAKVVVGS